MHLEATSEDYIQVRAVHTPENCPEQSSTIRRDGYEVSDPSKESQQVLSIIADKECCPNCGKPNSVIVLLVSHSVYIVITMLTDFVRGHDGQVARR